MRALARGKGALAAALAMGIASGGCSGGTPHTALDGAPNALLVTLDTTRADRFGCYGHSRDTTPHFDALAAEGVLFDLAISTSATTPPAHASILTGLNPHQHGVRVIHAGSGYALPETIPTLASILSERGWETGAFLSAFPVSEHYGFDRGFDTFDNGLAKPAEGVIEELRGGAAIWRVDENQRRSDATTDALIRWLEGRQGPFFAWVHYWDPHDPRFLPPEDVRRLFPPRDSADPDPRLDTYDSEVFFVDRQFGRVVRALKKLGVYDDTVIVVIADHGEGLGDHDWMHHRLLYQEQIRVPLILRIPGGPVGVRVARLVRNVDVYPTVLEALGVTQPRPVAGQSLLGLASGRVEEPRIAYADQLNEWDANAAMVRSRPLDRLLFCAMDRSWKLIYRARDPERSELYHIAVDPRETENLFSPTHPQYLRLKRELDAFDGYRWTPFPRGTIDLEVTERLRNLGYLGED